MSLRSIGSCTRKVKIIKISNRLMSLLHGQYGIEVLRNTVCVNPRPSKKSLENGVILSGLL